MTCQVSGVHVVDRTEFHWQTILQYFFMETPVSPPIPGSHGKHPMPPIEVFSSFVANVRRRARSVANRSFLEVQGGG